MSSFGLVWTGSGAVNNGSPYPTIHGILGNPQFFGCFHLSNFFRKLDCLYFVFVVLLPVLCHFCSLFILLILYPILENEVSTFYTTSIFLIRTSRQSVPRCGAAPPDVVSGRPPYRFLQPNHKKGYGRYI